MGWYTGIKRLVVRLDESFWVICWLFLSPVLLLITYCVVLRASFTVLYFSIFHVLNSLHVTSEDPLNEFQSSQKDRTRPGFAKRSTHGILGNGDITFPSALVAVHAGRGSPATRHARRYEAGGDQVTDHSNLSKWFEWILFINLS